MAAWLGRQEKTAIAAISLPALWLHGDYVDLRPPTLSDWAEWSKVRGRNQDYLRPLEPVWPEDALSESFFLRRLRRQVCDWELDQAYSFLMFNRDGGGLIGGININHVARGAAQYASLGYWLDEDHQGQGYMTEGLGLVIAHAFGPLKLHRLNAACLPENERSMGLLKRLGFEEEGFAQSYVQIAGRWRDHVLFGRVRETAPAPTP